jgi:hypothetical protein
VKGADRHKKMGGCGALLATGNEECIDAIRGYLAYMPANNAEAPVDLPPVETRSGEKSLRELIPANQNQAFDVKKAIRELVDAESFFELKQGFAKEIVTGFARIDGMPVGIVANQPKFKGGVLFVDSADKAARFIWLCNAFNIPLVFLADVPGFMIGTSVERQGIIRHGAKMIFAMSEATVPRISVIMRKAYGAGLYAMSGPGFSPDCTLALPSAMIAVMGPEAAVNAVYANKLAAIEDEQEREAYATELRESYEDDIDIVRLASELVVDEIVDQHAIPVVEVAICIERGVVEPELLDRAVAEPPLAFCHALHERDDPRLETVVLDVVGHRDRVSHTVTDLLIAPCVGHIDVIGPVPWDVVVRLEFPHDVPLAPLVPVVLQGERGVAVVSDCRRRHYGRPLGEVRLRSFSRIQEPPGVLDLDERCRRLDGVQERPRGPPRLYLRDRSLGVEGHILLSQRPGVTSKSGVRSIDRGHPTSGLLWIG